MQINGYTGLYNFEPFNIANPTLPKFYFNVKSQEQLIAIISCTIEELTRYVNSMNGNVDAIQKELETLQRLFDKFIESGFDDYYREILIKWMEDNSDWIFDRFAKMVFFGLTSDGYFCAYIPDSWSEITFDTGMVYGTAQYGRLILRFDADGHGIIDNTGDYMQSFDYESLRARVESLESIVKTALTKEG